MSAGTFGGGKRKLREKVEKVKKSDKNRDWEKKVEKGKQKSIKTV
jgi:hypothetical protein